MATFKAIKEIFFPILKGEPVVDLDNKGFTVIQDISATEVGYLNFSIPDDFGSLATAELELIEFLPVAGGSISVASNFGSEGEAFDVHFHTKSSTTGQVNDQLDRFDVSAVIPVIVAGDMGGLVIRTGENQKIRGLRFKYNPAF